MIPTTPEPQTQASENPGRLSTEELNNHARLLGIDAGLIQVQDINMPDCITIIIGMPDGRSLRRVVPRESWDDPAYRESLIRDMGLILA